MEVLRPIFSDYFISCEQPFKFRTLYSVEIKDNARGTYNTNSQIKFKTQILKSLLCDYGDT